MIPRLYCAQALEPGAMVVLPDHAAHHAVRVLRLKLGERVTLFNGAGGEFDAELARIAGREVCVQLRAHLAVERESPLAVTLVQALASADRMDYAVQKAVELGACAFQPVVSERSVARLDAARGAKRVAHWQQIAVAACEQCGRNRVPTVHALLALGDWLAAPSAAASRLLLFPEARTGLQGMQAPAGPVEILVGPEGGFTATEIDTALAGGWRAIRLGPRILRTESAGAAALAALAALWGDYA